MKPRVWVNKRRHQDLLHIPIVNLQYYQIPRRFRLGIIANLYIHSFFYIFNAFITILVLALTNDGNEDKGTNISLHIERTEVLYGIENAMSRLTQVMSRVHNRSDVCGDSLSPSFSIGVDSINKGYIDFKQRGVKIR